MPDAALKNQVRLTQLASAAIVKAIKLCSSYHESKISNTQTNLPHTRHAQACFSNVHNPTWVRLSNWEIYIQAQGGGPTMANGQWVQGTGLDEPEGSCQTNALFCICIFLKHATGASHSDLSWIQHSTISQLTLNFYLITKIIATRR